MLSNGKNYGRSDVAVVNALWNYRANGGVPVRSG